ncbi:NAD-dependent succinate-semialdehyde dehydrogenase [Paraburkholderia sp. JPY303]|uniref:Succinate-semialdehyde dehydrogenase/glutarate-semialdehyde dehydrogenase n=1 Tax=Paraburkholderia atlantica TaxID=2654982 RepID=A0A7W8V5H3_PARAM|nr:NAD-dependent succinate-semialdehyde dehydrogenase [Paraburkholderia atlantica]MBB5423789.1 succinate-semialdehyde dehydrogenase/glutarate-semialdehyde dehydrogenase [Paraburkholderia atlantica]NUY29489.1 NAD-dependent succinate-semialdehyde dehydrogenase [Paraburkholderia atlantica]
MYESGGLLIDGAWRGASDGECIVVRSPATGEPVGSVPAATEADEEAALAAAERGFARWSKTPAWERAVVLRRAADLLRARNDTYALLMSGETGKPLLEARGEINASADQFEWYAEEAKRIYGHTIAGRHADERLAVGYQPVGPCLALSAWNFPMLLPSRKIAAALAAGCSVIARPASEAPGSCMALGQVLLDAGLPAGVLGILTGHAKPMVARLVQSKVIRKVSLTGSVPVGKEILRLAADHVKKVTMELGGHAPVIVHADADPVESAKKLATTKFRNCGQVCISPSRFYVHRSILAPFAETFAAVARELRIGDGRDPATTLGPMIRARAVESALSLIEDARARGARVLAGGQRPSHLERGHFIEPTVLVDVPDDARIMCEEPFAPVAPIAAFDDVTDAITRANATEFGLAAYVFTHDSALAAMTAEALEAGMVGINETLLATAEAPFGGIKESGFGREGGSLGILDYLTPKYIRHRLIVRNGT